MSVKLSKDEFIQRSNDVHDSYYDYSKVDYVNSHTKVLILCPIHGVYEQKPYAHMNGQKCYECSRPTFGSGVKKNIDYIKMKFTI